MRAGAYHLGTAGASARRQAAQLQEDRARLGGWPTASGGTERVLHRSTRDELLEHEHERWTRQAEAEEELATLLAQRCPTLPMLHDRRAAGERASICHIAFACSAVFVIRTECDPRTLDALKRPFRHTHGDALQARMNAVETLEKQIAAVRWILSTPAPQLPVRGCICCIAPRHERCGGGLPRLRTVTVYGYPVYSHERLVRVLERRGRLSVDTALRLQTVLARQLEPAAGR